MVHFLDNYDVVVVHFNNSGSRGGDYNYKMHATLKPTVGDVVIIDTPYGGLATATVQRVCSKNSYEDTRATKWVAAKMCYDHMDVIKSHEEERKKEQARELEYASRIVTVRKLIEILPQRSKARALLVKALKEM